jgi:hypothetical protein
LSPTQRGLGKWRKAQHFLKEFIFPIERKSITGGQAANANLWVRIGQTTALMERMVRHAKRIFRSQGLLDRIPANARAGYRQYLTTEGKYGT